MSRNSRINRAITEAVIASRQLIPDLDAELRAGDSIFDLEVVTGQEEMGHWTRLNEVVVEQRHIEAADKAGPR